MQKHEDNLATQVDGAGLVPMPGVTVTVIDQSTGLAAALYSDNGVTPITAPIVTDNTGYYGFFAADGRYTITFTNPRIVTFTRDVILEDPKDNPYATLAQLAAPTGAALVGYDSASSVSEAINMLRLSDYTALRTYTGQRKSCYITGYLATSAPSGIAGHFVRDDTDTTTADNGGTVIVDGSGKRWKRQYSGAVQVKWFGAIGAGNDVAVVQAAVNACKNGLTLDFGSATYDFGTITNATWAVLIDSPVGMKLVGNVAQIHCTCTSGRASAFAVKNPQTFSSDGLEFSQPGYLIGSTGGSSNSANGTYGFLLFASAPFTAAAPCGNVAINGAARDCAGYVVVDGTTQMGAVSPVYYAMRNVKVNGVTERVFYGTSSIYGAVDLDTTLVCRDTRRAVVTYGQYRAKIDVTMECSTGFVGSNAMIELACEGTSVGDVRDIDIRARVSGCEAHDNIVNFYHQQSAAAGVIGNIKARVTCNNLTTAGKSGLIGTTSPFCFLHEDPNTGNPIASTSRVFQNCDIDCDVIGSISGPTLRLSSFPQVQYPITLGRGVTQGLVDFNMWNYFKVLRGARTGAFIPVVGGRTTAGTATYSLQKGEISVVDGVASYTMSLTWTGHNGTGNMYVSPLPVNAANSNSIGNPSASVLSWGFGATGAQIGALITDTGGTFTIYSVDSTSRGVSIPAVPASGTLYISGTFPLYA